jgi:hypothetical protein
MKKNYWFIIGIFVIISSLVSGLLYFLYSNYGNFIPTKREVLTCNGQKYVVLQQIENPYYIFREGSKKISNEVLTEKISRGVTELVQIQNVDKYNIKWLNDSTLTFIPDDKVEAVDINNLKSCFSTNEFILEKDIKLKQLGPQSFSVSGLECKNLIVGTSNQLVYDECIDTLAKK